jgi:outer membrane lipoprotein-sorting protein
MRPADNINEMIKKLKMKASTDLDRRVHDDISKALAESNRTESVVTQPKIGRTIMKSPIVKLAAAAVIIALVVLGLFEFTGTKKTSGVVWADVARKVQASRGLIFRCTDHSPSSGDDYSIAYTSPKYCRKDFYKDGQIIRTGYVDFTASDTDTLIDVFHIKKFCLTTTYKKSENGLFLEWRDDWTNPSFLVQAILSAEHSKLGRKTIEGVLCEGIETTDPTCIGLLPEQVNNFQMEFRLWVSIETGYPVLFERKMSGEHEGQLWETESVMDQFQWDVELDSSTFEPNVPPDYKGVERPGIVGL